MDSAASPRKLNAPQLLTRLIEVGLLVLLWLLPGVGKPNSST